jgi:hypothetical protein
MLWKFGGSNTFTNSVKTAALQKYLDGSDLDGYDDAISSMYITNKLISSDTPITSYLNQKSGGGNLDYDGYKSSLKQE